MQIVKATPEGGLLQFGTGMKQMVLSYALKRNADPVLAKRIRQQSAATLGLNPIKLDEPTVAKQ